MKGDILAPPERRHRAIIAAIGAALCLVCGLVGAQIANARQGSTDVHVSRVVTGTIAIVVDNKGEWSGCVQPDHGAKVCATMSGDPVLRDGQHVRAAVTEVKQGSSGGYPLLVILPDAGY